MPIRTSGGVFNDQVLTGSLAHYVVCGADFSGAINSFGQAVPGSAAEIIFTKISEGAYINIMNPNECNLSFALEAGRSIWDEVSLTRMIQSLGNNVGVDHVDCSVTTTKAVPYVWGCSSGAESFLDLADTPDSYAGAANYVVTVNSTETGLTFTPVGITSNAFSFIASPGQPSINATGSDTLNFLPGSNISFVLNPATNEITINAIGGGGENDYVSIPSGTALDVNTKYYVTTAGTVTLPSLDATSVSGEFVEVTKIVGINVFVNVGDVTDIINTDLGTTDSIEMDVTQRLLFIVRDSNNWDLQIGAIS